MRRALAASLLLVALVAAACGSGTPSSSASAASVSPSSAPSAAASQPADSAATTAPSDSVASPQPTPSPAVSATSEPSATDTPSDVPSSTPSASPSGAASACQPAGSNPNFWPGIAQSVSWDVYCAVLPKGWIVDAGQYRLAKGGWLKISYKGPNGAAIFLCEGSFPTDPGCSISGADSGDATFGSKPGTLVTTDAGGFAIAVDRGQQPSWILIASGLDQATTTSLGAALALVH